MRCCRHLALLSLLALAACGERATQAPTSPDGATPAFDKGVPCPTTSFPIASANQQIQDLYPNGARENSMLARAFDISKRWSQCKVADPQTKVGTFVQTLLQDFTAGRLNVFMTPPTTADRIQELIRTMYEGVGLTDPNIPVDQLKPGGQVASGLFIPGTPLLVRTSNAATRIPADAFSENTLITMYELRDDANPLFTDLNQFPPFYDINASNASGDHDLNGFAPLGFCVDQLITDEIDVAIGHNRRDGEGGFFFEVLPPITEAEFASLGLPCTPLANPASEGGSVGSVLNGKGTLGDLARGAWEAAQSGAMSMFFPQPAEAASSAANKGVGGRASSYSPFGIVDQSSGGYF